jgi:hypothetical protein
VIFKKSWGFKDAQSRILLLMKIVKQLSKSNYSVVCGHIYCYGNGRLSRILTTFLPMQAGYVYVTHRTLESVIEQNKQGYYMTLRQTQSTIRAGAPD